MKSLRKIFNFYIDASVHVAAAVTSLVWITVTELKLETTSTVYWFVFFGTITGYNFVKYATIAKFRHKSLSPSLRAIQVFSFLCILFAGYFFYKLPWKAWYVTAAFGVLTFFYVIPFLPAFRRSLSSGASGVNLRTLSGFKIFIVGLVWAGVSVVLPWAMTSASFSQELWLTFIQRFLLVVVWTIPFEIRDLTSDQDSLRTLPQQLGIKRTKGVGLLLLIIAMVLESLKHASDLSHFMSFVVLFFITAFVIAKSRKEQSRYFASFWVESIPILWMLLFFILKNYLDIS